MPDWSRRLVAVSTMRWEARARAVAKTDRRASARQERAPLAYWLRRTVDGSARCIKTAKARVSPPALTTADWMPTTR